MGESMTRTNLRTYTPDFSAGTVKLLLEQGISLEAAAQLQSFVALSKAKKDGLSTNLCRSVWL
jgi:c-di-GMP-binding flagellar brake protein YcgR